MNIRTTVKLAVLTFGSALSLWAEKGDPNRYQVTNLTSDVAGLTPVTDPHLGDPWGLSVSPTAAWWVSDNATGLSTLYDGTGAIQSLVVTVPNAAGDTAPSSPTGTVFNGSTTDFAVAAGKPAHFLFVTETGTVSGWNSGASAVLMVDNSGKADYTGLAIADSGGANFLFAANFKTGAVDVFDAKFAPVALAPDAFHDPLIPRGFAPFNAQTIGDSIYVTFARQDPASIGELHGPGVGFVDRFSPTGALEQRLQWGLWFNAPWGVALAPADFGEASNLLVVGQSGSGKIAAFDPTTGQFRGWLTGDRNRPIAIEGLKALSFGNGAAAGPTTTLYFLAGIDDGAHGFLGSITAAPTGSGDDHGGNDDEHGGRRN